jgi:hypothetical protein
MWNQFIAQLAAGITAVDRSSDNFVWWHDIVHVCWEENHSNWIMVCLVIHLFVDLATLLITVALSLWMDIKSAALNVYFPFSVFFI